MKAWTQTKFVKNLTPKQRIALESLTKNKKPSDKDGSIVVLDKEKYDKACLDILMDTNYCEELNENSNTSYKEKFTEEIQNLLQEKLIIKNEYDILLEGTETPSLYEKPKTHKTLQDIPTFRSICNWIGSCSVHMSEFIDNFLHLLSRKNSSYVKDTTDFLNKISKIYNSPGNKKNKPILVSMDVQSLYSNIGHK